MVIAVCGNIGSGKTTLAKYISSQYGFRYIPQKRFEGKFISDFFKDIPTQFLPTQLSFLLSKIREIRQSTSQNLVIDRSLLEDVQVFARLWMDTEEIEPRVKSLYCGIAQILLDSTLIPDLSLVCRCSTETIRRRLKERPPRSYEDSYPPNHIEHLNSYYEAINFESRIATVNIDAERCNFTNRDQLRELCTNIFAEIERRQSSAQLSLFDEYSAGDRDNEVKHRFFEINMAADATYVPFHSPVISTKNDLYIYLAAPFTAFATGSRNHSDETEFFLLPRNEPQYGTISKGYQKKLLRVEKAAKEATGRAVFLPHRDMNKWGRVEYPASAVMKSIMEVVANASAVIAIPAQSIGVHLELGIAMSRGIPVLGFAVKNMAQSFYIDGFKMMDNVRIISVDSFSQIPQEIQKPANIQFLMGEVK